MKTETQENNQGRCGGGTSARLIGITGAGLALLALASCGTSGTVRPTAGGSMIDSTSARDLQTRVKGSRVISVNGAGSAGTSAHVAAGLAEVKVRYQWPQGGAQEVDLRFRARPDRKYFVKYAAFPPSVDKLSGTTALSTSAQGIGDAGFGIMERHAHPVGALVGTVVLAPAIVLGTADYFGRVGADIADKHRPAQWVDMMVISEQQAEGVVRFVRVYPSGQVVWQPWDACSNAPGNAQHGRLLNQRPSTTPAPRDEPSGTVFRRHALAE